MRTHALLWACLACALPSLPPGWRRMNHKPFVTNVRVKPRPLSDFTQRSYLVCGESFAPFARIVWYER